MVADHQTGERLAGVPGGIGHVRQRGTRAAGAPGPAQRLWSLPYRTCHAGTHPDRGGAPVAATEAVPTRRSLRWLRFAATVTAILLLLFGLPWWTFLVAGARWPASVVLAGRVL